MDKTLKTLLMRDLSSRLHTGTMICIDNDDEPVELRQISDKAHYFSGGSSQTVEFSPLYNSDGKIILVKHNADEICAFLHEGGYTDYSTGVVVDAEIHMAPDGWNYMDEFKQEVK